MLWSGHFSRHRDLLPTYVENSFHKVRPRKQLKKPILIFSQLLPCCTFEFLFSHLIHLGFFFYPLVEYLIVMVNISLLVNQNWLCCTYSSQSLLWLLWHTHTSVFRTQRVPFSLWLLCMFVSKSSLSVSARFGEYCRIASWPFCPYSV